MSCSWPVCASHNCTMSVPAVASRRPSGLNRTQLTLSVKLTQRERLLTRVHVPDLHFPFLICCPTARGGQALTVRAEGYTPHSDPAGVFQLKQGRWTSP